MPCYRKGRASKHRAQGAGASERRFADGAKAMVRGEGIFAGPMRIPANLIGGNTYVANPPQSPRTPENTFNL